METELKKQTNKKNPGNLAVAVPYRLPWKTPKFCTVVSNLRDTATILRKTLAEVQPICRYSCWVRQGSLE